MRPARSAGSGRSHGAPRAASVISLRMRTAPRDDPWSGFAWSFQRREPSPELNSCSNRLRSAAHRRETYTGHWLPEPVVTGVDGTDPLSAVVAREDARFAVMVVLERLSPDQRVAFVLHDGFAVPFSEVARVLGTTEPAARIQSPARVTTLPPSVVNAVAPPVRRTGRVSSDPRRGMRWRSGSFGR